MRLSRWRDVILSSIISFCIKICIPLIRVESKENIWAQDLRRWSATIRSSWVHWIQKSAKIMPAIFHRKVWGLRYLFWWFRTASSRRERTRWMSIFLLRDDIEEIHNWIIKSTIWILIIMLSFNVSGVNNFLVIRHASKDVLCGVKHRQIFVPHFVSVFVSKRRTDQIFRSRACFNQRYRSRGEPVT